MALVAFLAGGTGCSLIGFSAGVAIDSSKQTEVATTAAETLALSSGQSIEVLLDDGATLSGTYAGAVCESGDDYEHAYDTSREKLLPDHVIPELGAFITVYSTRQTSASTDGNFLGVDRAGLLMKTRHDSELVPWPGLSTVVTRPRSHEWSALTSGKVFADLTATGEIPSAHGIWVANGDARNVVSFTDVSEIRAQPRRNTKWKMLAVGAVLDAVGIALLARAMSDFGPIDMDISGFGTP